MDRISNGQSPAFGNPHIIGSRSLIVGDILFNSVALVSRGTTCWLASVPAEGRAGPSPLDLVMKMAWRYSQRSNEAALLKRCQERGVKGIAVLYCYDDQQPTTHGILGKCLPDARPFDLDWKTQKQPSPYCSKAWSSPLINARPTYECLAFGTRTSVPDRSCTWVVTVRGKPLSDTTTNPLKLLLTMRDALRGHQSLLETGGILHRDVSINHIMTAITPREDGYEGFLIDLDHAVAVENDAPVLPSGAPERTGTYEFLSIEALLYDTGLIYEKWSHSYYDDLQSFFFVLVWVCLKPEAEMRQRWQRDRELAGLMKRAVVTTQDIFEEMLLSFKDELHEIGSVARELKEVLWGSGFSRDRNSMYRKMVAAIQSGINGLDVGLRAVSQ
jgi:hypothetical protein